VLRFTYVRSPEDITLHDVSKNVSWINTTLTNTNMSKVDDLKLAVKMRPALKRDDAVWVTSTTLLLRVQLLMKVALSRCLLIAIISKKLS